MIIEMLFISASLIGCSIIGVMNNYRISNLEKIVSADIHSTKQFALAMMKKFEKHPELAERLKIRAYPEGTTQKMLDAIEIYKQIEKAKALGLI